MFAPTEILFLDVSYVATRQILSFCCTSSRQICQNPITSEENFRHLNPLQRANRGLLTTFIQCFFFLNKNLIASTAFRQADRKERRSINRLKPRMASDLLFPSGMLSVRIPGLFEPFPTGCDVEGGAHTDRNMQGMKRRQEEQGLKRLERRRKSVSLYSPGCSFSRHSWIQFHS